MTSDLPGGEIGYGQNVHAFYELEPVAGLKKDPHNTGDGKEASSSKGPLATVVLQYEALEDHQDHRIIRNTDYHVISFEKADPGFRFGAAAALFGMIMRQSAYAGTGDLKMVGDILRHVRDKDNKDTRKSLLKLIQKAERISPVMP